MKKFLIALLFLIAPLARAAEKPVTPEQFNVICSMAKDMDQTPEGQAYEPKFVEAIHTVMAKTLQDCAQGAKLPVQVNIVLVIAGNGKIAHVFAEPGVPVSACVAAKLIGEKVPKPPKADWMLLVNVNVHN